MKKKPIPSPQTPPPAPKLSLEANAKLMRFALLLALVAPLIDTLLIFPLRQILLANLGTGILYQVLYYATEAFNLLVFFLLLALAVYSAIANSPKTLGRIVALHGISSIFIVVLLRMGLYYLMAWADYQLLFPFDLCNQTLNSLTRNSGAELLSLTLSLFIGQVILFTLLVAVIFIALRARQKQLAGKADLSPLALCNRFDLSPVPKLLNAGLILYVCVALINQIFDTVSTVINLGMPDGFGTLLSLIVPYFLLAIYTLLGYLALDYGARYIAKEAAI